MLEVSVEQVFNWQRENQGSGVDAPIALANRAANWGADQELQECVKVLSDPWLVAMSDLPKRLQSIRRPHTLQQKGEEALNVLTELAQRPEMTLSLPEFQLVFKTMELLLEAHA